jgi:DNA repair protein RadA
MANKAFRCTNCGHVVKVWEPQCPECKQFDTLDRDDSAQVAGAKASGGMLPGKTGARAARAATGRAPQRINDIKSEDYARISTGLAEFDRVLGGGLVPGGVILLAGEPGVGKALALDTKLPTPTGWTTMGEVQVGDQLIGADGNPATVVALTPIQKDRPVYEVRFSDGSIITADEEHEWLTTTRRNRLGRGIDDSFIPKTTGEIFNSLRIGWDNRLNHAVAVAAPLNLPEKNLTVPPYTLGAWLGAGTSSSATITSADQQILDNIASEGVTIVSHKNPPSFGLQLPKHDESLDVKTGYCDTCGSELKSWNPATNRCIQHRHVHTLAYKLREIGVLNNKHIPEEYLRASEAQRRLLLAGLLDTDGYIDAHSGRTQLALTSKRLADDAFELIVSLGYKASRKTKRVKGASEESSICYMTNFTTSDLVFAIDRKNARSTGERSTQKLRYIESVTPVKSVPVKCLEVDNADHMYLAGETMIPIHNSSITTVAAKALADRGKKVLIISGEETEAQIASRAKRMNATSDNIYLLAESNLTNALSHISTLRPDVLVVDSMQTLVSDNSEGRVGSPAQVAEVANDLTQLAKGMNIPTILIGHITKDGNIAGPRVVEHLVDVVLYFEGSKDSGLRLLRGVKNRYGASDEIGCFEHTEEGLVEVTDPSGFFLSEHEQGVTGFATSILVEGNRAIPIEIQALVTPTKLPNPRKISNGLDHSRVMMIQAILEKHGRLRLNEKDVYVSTTGGLLTKDSSIDLAIAAAIISSSKSWTLPEHSVFLGETSLTGEIRSPRMMSKRVNEARRLGFSTIFMANKEAGASNLVTNIRQLIKELENDSIDE